MLEWALSGSGARARGLPLYPAASQPIIITTAPFKWRPDLGRRQPMTWARFVGGLVALPIANVRRKERLSGWSPATFAGDHRCLAGVERGYLLGLDLDGGGDVARAARTWSGVAAVAHSSYSHDPEHGEPRVRLVILLSRAVTIDEYRRLWSWAARRSAAAGFKVDMGKHRPSDYFYRPATAPGRSGTYEWRCWGRTALDVDRVLATVPTTETRRPDKRGERGARASTPGDIEAARSCFFGQLFGAADMVNGELESGVIDVVCPWESEHTSRDSPGDTVVFAPRDPGGMGGWYCNHAHCLDAKRTAIDVAAAMPPEALATAREACGGYGFAVVTAVRARLRVKPDAGPEWPPFKRIEWELADERGEIIRSAELVIPTVGRHASAKIRAAYNKALPDVPPELLTLETWRSPDKPYNITGRRLLVSLRDGFVQGYYRALAPTGGCP